MAPLALVAAASARPEQRVDTPTAPCALNMPIETGCGTLKPEYGTISNVCKFVRPGDAEGSMDRRSLLGLLAVLPGSALMLPAQALAWQVQSEESLGSSHLRTIGILTTATVQNAYLLLDVASISLSRGGIPAERVRSLCRALVRQLDGVIGQLRRLEDEDLTVEDAAFVDGAMQTCRALQDDSRALGKFADRQTAQEQRAFEKSHQLSEQAVRDLVTDRLAKAASGTESRDRGD